MTEWQTLQFLVKISCPFNVLADIMAGENPDTNPDRIHTDITLFMIILLLILIRLLMNLDNIHIFALIR